MKTSRSLRESGSSGSSWLSRRSSSVIRPWISPTATINARQSSPFGRDHRFHRLARVSDLLVRLYSQQARLLFLRGRLCLQIIEQLVRMLHHHRRGLSIEGLDSVESEIGDRGKERREVIRLLAQAG